MSLSRDPALGHRDRRAAQGSPRSDEESGFGYASRSRATADVWRWPTSTSFASSTPPRAGWNGRSTCPARGAIRPRSRPTGRLVAMPDHNTVALFEVVNRPAAAPRPEHARRLPGLRRVGSRRAIGSSRDIPTVSSGSGTRRPAGWSGTSSWPPRSARRAGTPLPSFVGFSRDGQHVVAAGPRDDPVEPARRHRRDLRGRQRRDGARGPSETGAIGGARRPTAG